MLILIGAFLAGVITVFAPCVFALLPVIVGGSISGDVRDKRRPFVIVVSLAVSLLLFTLLLKATAFFINIPPALITSISGGIIVLLGLALLFPSVYDRVIVALNLQAASQRLLGKSAGKGALIGAVITGVALGPVFSSCSPVYAYILATILPVNFGAAMVYILAYVAGLSVMLLLVGFLGQRIVRRLKWASNPHGWFQRIVAVLFIIVGLLVITGYDKKFQVYIADHTPFDFDGLSAQLIPASDRQVTGGILNVAQYDAPELRGISTWINSRPQTIAGLKGKVVLVDFWTYSCINCIRTQPYLKQWYERYHDSGLEIIGVHAPEFSFEKNPDNVRQAVKDAGLPYPIAMDNDLKTWAAYDNHYWPATYLIDREGKVRRVHSGEGKYSEQEQAIRQLLAQNGTSLPGVTTGLSGTVPSTWAESPETYFGTERAAGFQGKEPLQDGEHRYVPGALERVNQWTLGGTWKVTNEGVTAVNNSKMWFRAAAKDVYVVTGSATRGKIMVSLNGEPISMAGAAGEDVKDSALNVSMAQLYHLVHFDKFNSDAMIQLDVPAGVQINTFTFGS